MAVSGLAAPTVHRSAIRPTATCARRRPHAAYFKAPPMSTKAPPLAPAVYEPHWAVLGTGFGGGSQISGDAVITPNSVGGALAGGGTRHDRGPSGVGGSDQRCVGRSIISAIFAARHRRGSWAREVKDR